MESLDINSGRQMSQCRDIGQRRPQDATGEFGDVGQHVDARSQMTQQLPSTG